jgi:DNA repair exonuclease SbcCD nuclease subunit
MIRLILAADTHLGFDYPIRPRVARRRRGEDFFNNFQSVLTHAVESGADLVVHGGDLFFRSKLPKKIVDMTYRILLDFAGSGIDHFIVPGNHERSILPASVFLGHPKILIFDRPRTYRIEVKGAKLSLSGFPCVRDDIRESFLPLLQETEYDSEPADIRLLCLHQAVEGSSVAHYTFRHGPDVLPMKLLPEDFTAVLCGHIHRRQILKRGNVPVIYPGSIERTSFAEKDEDKGFYELVFEKSTSGSWRISAMKFIELPARPMVDLVLGHVEELKSKVSGIHPDAIVRIKPAETFDPALAKSLNGTLLREVFPKTMNYQLSSAFFHGTRR